MTTTETEAAPVLDAVKDLLPTLRKNGVEAEDNRWIPQENIDLLEKAGVFQAAVPRRYGGYDLSLADQAKILSEVSRGCASTGWVAMVWVSSAWIATLLPERTQDEVFAGGSVRISGGFTPSGTLTPAKGPDGADGYLLSGTWRFNSGCQGADWNFAAAIRENPDGSSDEAVAVVPMDAFSIADDWHVSSMAATGSSTSTASDVFVPAHHVVSFEHAALNTRFDHADGGPDNRGYRLFTFIFASAVAACVGIARGALDLFLERVPGRGVSYTDWTDQSQYPVTQVQVGLAANKIAAAEGLLTGIVDLLQRRADAGEDPTWEEKAAVRGQSAYAIQLAKEATEILYRASGASVIQRSAPLQRFHRDMEGVSLHGLLLLETNLEVHGRVLLGLDPATPFL